MQRDQDVVVAGAESADPVLRVALTGITHQFRAVGGAGDERSE